MDCSKRLEMYVNTSILNHFGICIVKKCRIFATKLITKVFGMKNKTVLFFACAMFASQMLYAQAPFSKAGRNYVEYLVLANHAQRTYQLGDEARVTIEAFKGGNPLNGEYLYYKVGDEMLLPAQYDSIPFHNGKAEISLGTMKQPGFRACNFYFNVEGKKYKDEMKLAYAPQEIKPYTVMPSDFDKFWKRSLKQLDKIEAHPEITPMHQYSTKDVEVSLVKITVGKNGRCMFGYLAKPKDGKKHPVLFQPPGAGSSKVRPYTYYAEQGYIVVTSEIHGLDPRLSDADYQLKREEMTKDYNMKGIDNKDTFYYHDVYLGCSRWIDFLCSLPEFDGKNVCVTGGSQGGALTVVTAALNPKVTCIAPFYPALNDLTGFLHQRAGGWPKYFSSEHKTGKFSEEQIKKAAETLAYYDVVNFARRITVPGFYSFGYNDPTCSPTSVYGMYNEIKAPKKIEVTPSSGHWRFWETNERSERWLKSQLK